MIGDDDRNRGDENRDEVGSGHAGGDERPRGRGRGGGRGARDNAARPPADSLRDDDADPRGSLRDFKIGKARAETGKAIEPILEAIALEDSEYLKTRKAIEAAYAAATADSDSADNLSKRYCAADAAFREALTYLLAKAPGQNWGLLEEWLHRNLREEDAPVRKILIERRQVRARLRDRKGPRELALQDAHEKTENWAKAWANWSDPVKNIGDIIKSYEPRIGVLKDLFNDKPTADKAILEFWFEVAPAHLGLRSEPVTNANAPGVELVRAALGDFEDVQARLSNASARREGGLYLIDSDRLRGTRERVLDAWEEAANDEAVAKADYDLRRDDAARLGERHDVLTGDKWLARAKDLLAAPATE